MTLASTGDMVLHATDPVLTIAFQVDRDGSISNDTQTHGSEWADVYRAFHAVKAELDRQIAARRNCPFNPKNPQPPTFEDDNG